MESSNIGEEGVYTQIASLVDNSIGWTRDGEFTSWENIEPVEHGNWVAMQVTEAVAAERGDFHKS